MPAGDGPVPRLRGSRRRGLRRFPAPFGWCLVVWLVLTWTTATEQLVFGAILAAVVALGLLGFGDVAAPWRLLDPRTALRVGRLGVVSLARIARANVELAVRIWRPSRPLRSGMIVLPTSLRTDAGLGALGLITSLIVDNQVVDVDRAGHRLQFHAVAVPHGDLDDRREAVSAPTERLLAALVADEGGTEDRQ